MTDHSITASPADMRQGTDLEAPNLLEELINDFENLKPVYERLVNDVTRSLNIAASVAGIKVVAMSGRVKATESVREKVQRKNYVNPAQEVTDLAGVRVVCRFSSEVRAIDALVREQFVVINADDKNDSLGSDLMGYSGKHYVISLPEREPDGDDAALKQLKCEIQVRTILQDAWAQISHTLLYKSEASVPLPERRELNNVSSLLEIAQGVFDRSRVMRQRYVGQVKRKQGDAVEFLSQPIDRETVSAYTRWKYPGLPIKDHIQERMIGQIDHARYRTLDDLDRVVVAAKRAVDAYKAEVPDTFKAGTDHITKSLGFVDPVFRRVHGFASRSKLAFHRFQHLVDPFP